MPRKILIVDDNGVNRRILHNILSGEYELLEAGNGQEALDALERFHKVLSAVLLDLSMPVMDGYAVLARMGENPALSQIPVIVTTASTDSRSEVRALTLGAQDFVTKPYNPDIIKRRLNNLIKLRETAAAVNALHRDRLTGLFTWEHFAERAAELIAAREPGYYILSCVDIDNFKVINDQYSIETGDEVLRGIAAVLKRDCETEDSICCRIAADDFAVLFPRRLAKFDDGDQLSHEAAILEEVSIPITVSIGRYIVDDASLSISAMCDRAKIAQSTVKGRFDVHMAVFDESMRMQILRAQEIVDDMNLALEAGQFEVWFQPQYNHASGALIGAEALARWRHPERGLIPPGEFIPVFERNGFVYKLDRFVWEQTCRLLRKWLDEGRSPLPVSVNISRYDVFRKDFSEVLSGLLAQYKIPVELLRLEITESAFTESTDQIIHAVKKLIDAGFTVEIDDFGSGYSSLNTLKDVPAQIVKLDMRFLEGESNTDRGGNIIESVVRMVKWLGMSVIAEGVETVRQAEYLKSIGCNYVQGYLYARPMPAADYEALAKTVVKEEKMIALETVENLDNNAFWDPNSMDTLIFNSYVGGACIFEYCGGRIELLRATEKYAQVIGSAGMTIADALKLDWSKHLDEENQRALTEDIRHSIKTKDEVTSEYTFLNLPNCPERTYLRSTLRVIATAGSRYLLYCTNENITAQREAEHMRREAEERERLAATRLSAIMKNIEGGVSAAVMDGKNSRYIFANDQFYAMLGYTKEQFEAELPGGLADRIHPADMDRVAEAVSDNELHSGSTVLEFRIYRRDGSLMWMRANGSVCRITGEERPVHIAVHTDITAAKQTEERIRALNENLLNMMNDTPGGFVRMRVLPDGAVATEYVNESFCRLRGMTAEEIMAVDGGNAMGSVHPDDAEMVRGAISRMIATGATSNLKYRLKRADGTYIPLNVFGRVTKNEAGEPVINAYYAELTEQERRDLTIRDAMPFILSTIMASSTDLSFVKDRSLHYLCCSKPFALMVGLASETDVAGKTDYDLFDRETADQYREIDQAVLDGGASMVDYLEPIPSNDGIQHYSSTSKYILRDTAGGVIGLYGVGRDVTDTRTAFEQLKLLTDNIPGGIASYVDTPGERRLVYCNDGFCRMLGFAREEYASVDRDSLIGLTFREDLPAVLDQVAALLRDDTPLNCTFRIHSRSGEGYKWVNLRGGVSERRGDTVSFNAILFDVTEAKLAEEAARVHAEEIKLALSKMSRIISEYDIETRTLTFPDTYYKKYNLPQVARNVPYGMQKAGGMTDETFGVYTRFYEAILRGGNPAPIEIQKSSPDGAVRWERITAYTVFNEDGKPVKALVAADDTTEQHLRFQLEQSRPTLGEKNLLVHALFNMTDGSTLDYAYEGGGEVPIRERTAFLYGKDNLDDIIIDADERAKYRRLNDAALLLERYKNGETEFSIDYRRRLKSGDIRWVRNILRLVRQPGGDDILLFEYCYDIEEEKLQELMNGVLITANYDYVMRVNGRDKSFVVMTSAGRNNDVLPPSGADMDAVARELAEKRIHPEDREAALLNTTVAGMLRSLADREQFQFTYREVQPGGGVRYKKQTEFYLDRALQIIVVTREDITEIMEVENTKNGALASALEAANQASFAKTAFLSRMSHELRTPMNAIIGLSALSASELDKPKVLEDNIAKIGMSARYLLSLINDILEMSRIESGKMTLSTAAFDFERFVSEVNAIIFAQAEGKGVDYDAIVDGSVSPSYEGDAVKLQEILVNVLGNAVKFTPAGGKVTLSIEQLRCVKRRATLRFTVSDTGVGIDEAFLPRLFDPFTQESTGYAPSAGGTGLGLAITKNLVEMMDGQITVKSIKNMGSVFSIDVQLGVSENSRRYLDMVSSMRLDKLRALVVDDDVTVCRSTESILTAMGIRAEWVDSGLLALERVEEAREKNRDFDTIFIDWKMPDMDGIETTRRIRKIAGPEVTIIIMTAYDWKTIEAEALAAGVDLFMEKPLFQSSIVKAFERVFLANRDKLEPPQPARPDFTGRRILLAEDHPLNTEVAKRMLEKVHAEVVAVDNGLAAIETFTTAPDGFFDAILMDIHMPVMDGLTATRGIRNLRKSGSKDIPIVAMTADAFDEDVELSLSSGMNAHLSKPIEPETLFTTLGRLMK